MNSTIGVILSFVAFALIIFFLFDWIHHGITVEKWEYSRIFKEEIDLDEDEKADIYKINYYDQNQRLKLSKDLKNAENDELLATVFNGKNSGYTENVHKEYIFDWFYYYVGGKFYDHAGSFFIEGILSSLGNIGWDLVSEEILINEKYHTKIIFFLKRKELSVFDKIRINNLIRKQGGRIKSKEEQDEYERISKFMENKLSEKRRKEKLIMNIFVLMMI